MQILLSLILIVLIFSLLLFGFRKRVIIYSKLEIHTGNKDRNINLSEYLKDINEYFRSMRYRREDGKIKNESIVYLSPPLLINRGEKVEIFHDTYSISIYGADYKIKLLKEILKTPGSTFEVEPDDRNKL